MGEPNLPITFGGVARKGIMPADVTNVAGDHDFHKVSLTPSVALEVVIKPHEGEGDGLQSFYRGVLLPMPAAGAAMLLNINILTVSLCCCCPLQGNAMLCSRTLSSSPPLRCGTQLS